MLSDNYPPGVSDRDFDEPTVELEEEDLMDDDSSDEELLELSDEEL